MLLVSMWFFKRVTKRYEDYQAQEAMLSTTLQENLTGVRVVKAFARQEYEKSKFEKDNWSKVCEGQTLLFMHSMFWPLSDIVLGLQMLFGFLYAAFMAINGEISVGTYIAYAGLVVWLIWPIRNLGRIIVNASTGLVSYGRLMEVVSAARALSMARSSRRSGAGDIVFDNVSFVYSTVKSGVEETSPSTSSRPVDCLTRLYWIGQDVSCQPAAEFHEYTGGHILLDGVELTDYSRPYLRQQIGIVEQEPFLFSAVRSAKTLPTASAEVCRRRK